MVVVHLLCLSSVLARHTKIRLGALCFHVVRLSVRAYERLGGLESCTGMGITVFPRLLRGNGEGVHSNTTGTKFTVILWERGDLLR